MTNEVVAALIGAGVGSLGGAIGSYVVGFGIDASRNLAVRMQLVSLMRVVEQQMLIAAKYSAVPIDKWASLGHLERVLYSTDGARALSKRQRAVVFPAFAEVQQVRAAIDYTHSKQIDRPGLIVEGNAIVQPVSDGLRARWRQEIRNAGNRGVVLLKTARATLNDTQTIEDPIKDPDDETPA